MTTLTCSALPLALAAALATGAGAQASAASPPGNARAPVRGIPAVDSVLGGYLGRGQVAGAVALVWHKGSVAHRAAYGRRSLAAAQPVEVTDFFRIASMTKPVTSVAALILIERGKLALDDPVSKFIPSFRALRVFDGPGRTRPAKRAMTVRHLLTHTSGLPGGFGFEAVDPLYTTPGALDATSLDRYVESIAKLPLADDPGARWIYSYSTNVLGRVIEVASGRPLDAFFRDEVFAPLGMDATGFVVAPRDTARLVDVAQWTGLELRRLSGPRRDPTKRPGMLSGNGGLYSTADDYLMFALMLMNGGQLAGRRVLSAELVRSMLTDQLGPGMPDWGVGAEPMPGQRFGFGVTIVSNARAAGHPGAAGSFYWPGSLNTFFWVDPANEVVGILLMQYDPFRGLPIEPEFRRAVYRGLLPAGPAPSGAR